MKHLRERFLSMRFLYTGSIPCNCQDMHVTKKTKTVILNVVVVVLHQVPFQTSYNELLSLDIDTLIADSESQGFEVMGASK